MSPETEAEYQAVRVEVVSMPPAAPHSCSGPAREKVVTRFGQETVDNSNKVRPLLPDDPDRLIAHVQVTGGDVYLCASEQDAKRTVPSGSVLPSANTAPWPLRGQQAVWIAQKTADSTCAVDFTADYQHQG